MRETAIIESDCCLYYNFFFSSRRRQTRWPRDWSSDVCSSDLCQRQDELSATPGIPRCVPSVGSTLNGRRLYGTVPHLGLQAANWCQLPTAPPRVPVC